MRKFIIECDECDSYYEIELIEGEGDHILCCPFCHSVNPRYKEEEDEEKNWIYR